MKIIFEYESDEEKAEVLTSLKSSFRVETDDEAEAKAKELALGSLKRSFVMGQIRGNRPLRAERLNKGSLELKAEEGKTQDIREEIKSLREERLKDRKSPRDLRARSKEIFGGA